MAKEETRVSFLREKVEIQDPKLNCGIAAPLTHLLFWVNDIKLLRLTLFNVPTALHVLFLTVYYHLFFS